MQLDIDIDVQGGITDYTPVGIGDELEQRATTVVNHVTPIIIIVKLIILRGIRPQSTVNFNCRSYELKNCGPGRHLKWRSTQWRVDLYPRVTSVGWSFDPVRLCLVGRSLSYHPR